MKLRLTLAAAAVLVFGTPAAAQDTPAAAAPDYASDSAWLCLPGRVDACGRPLPTVALSTTGYGSLGEVKPDPAAKVDCFYVYPTVSRDPGLNSDLTPGLEEQVTAQVQLGRFATACRTFAPIYRQVTLGAIPRAFAGENVQPAFEIAYADVLAAWRQYLATRNQGRPFVLIGHSQGSVHLIRLLREEVEGKPEAKRMLSAIVLGWAVEVPPGKTVGGSFKSTPLCTRAGETGCVITYMSFRASSPPPDPSFLGRAAMQGMTAACTNPAALGGGRAKLDSYWFAMRPADPGSTPIVWSSQGAPATPFVRTEGLATGECVHSGSAGYLAIDVDADPVDARTDTIPGDVYIGGQVAKSWGMHLADMNVAQGDLIRLVEAQAAAFSASATPATHSKAKPPKAHRR